MLNIVLKLLVTVGLAIAMFGVGVDFLLPGSSPGFNLPQLLVVAAGVGLLIIAALLRSSSFRQAILRRRGISLAVALVVALATIFALEIVLKFWGISTYYRHHSTDTELTLLPWRTCGAAGCHYDYDNVQAACETGELRNRHCRINKQGYSDAEDFVLPPDWEDRIRILLLGDSFTWGASADIGRSFAEILETALPQAIIWNTGITGTGTNQALLAFEGYAPVLLPQLTILGFVPNDFNDNLLPVDSWANALDADGNAFLVRKYGLDEDLNVIELDFDTLGFIRAHGRPPPYSELEWQLGSTRLGTLLLRLRDMAQSPTPVAASYERHRQITKQYLLELNQAVSSNGSKLLVLLVPYSEDIEDLQGVRPRFSIGKELMRELEIPYLNPISILDPVADYGLPLDSHWTNSGHRKVGAILSDCVKRFLDSGDFSDCAHIKLP